MAETTAFIGVGNMGGPMAANLAKADYDVVVFDLSAAVCEDAKGRGLTVASSVGDRRGRRENHRDHAARGQHVVSVWGELAGRSEDGALLIDCSTIDVASAREAHALVDGRGRLTVDAPVSGGTGGAEAGTLTFMVGGSKSALAAGAPVLGRWGRRWSTAATPAPARPRRSATT